MVRWNSLQTGYEIIQKEKDVLFAEDESGVFEDMEDFDMEKMPELSAEQKETAAIIKSLIDELPELQKMALISYYYDGHSVPEIAEMQECSEGTVKSRLNYARKALKDKVEAREKKDGCRLHVFALPTLWFAIRMLAEETILSEETAQGIYSASCKAVGLKATALKIAERAGIVKKTGLGMKWASLSVGSRVATVAVTVVVAGAVTISAVNAATHKGNSGETEPVVSTEAVVEEKTEPTEIPVATETTDSAENTTVDSTTSAADGSSTTEAGTTETASSETPAASETPSVETTAPVQKTVWATTSLNLRSEASASSDKVGSLAKGDMITVIGEPSADGWYMADYNDRVVYVKAAYLSDTEVAKDVKVPAKKQTASNSSASSNKGNSSNSSNSGNSSNQQTSNQNQASAPAAPAVSAPAQNSQSAATPAPAQEATQPTMDPGDTSNDISISNPEEGGDW